jgi:hypothetical protein
MGVGLSIEQLKQAGLWPLKNQLVVVRANGKTCTAYISQSEKTGLDTPVVLSAHITRELGCCVGDDITLLRLHLPTVPQEDMILTTN